MADTLDLTGLARPATPPVIPAPDPIDVALDAFLASNPRAKEFGFGPKPPPVDLTDLAKPARSPKGDLPKAASVDLTGLAKPATKPISGNLFTEAAHGFEGSALGGNAQLTGNAAEGFGVLTDSQLLQDTGKKISAFGAASQQGLEAQVPSFTDIRTDSLGNFLGDVGRYGGYQVGSMVGSSIPPLVAGLGATAVTENPAVGLFAGAFGPSYIQNFGDLYGSVRDDKDIQSLVAKGQITQKGVAGTAALAAVPMAALDSFGLERMLGKTAFSSVKQDLMRRIVKGVGTGAIYEGSTEGLQQIVQEWAQDHLGSQKSLHDSVVSVIDNALAGALGGGVMGGVGGAFGGVGRVDEQQPPPNTPPPRAPLNGQIIPPETPPPGSPQVGERPTIDLKVNQPPPAEPAVNLPSVPDWPTTEKPVATSHPPLRIELNLGERDKLMGDQPADLTGLARPALPPPESASNPASASSAQNVQNPEITQKTGVPTVETPKNGVESPVIALPDLSGLARPVRGAGVQQSPAHALAEGDVARADAHVAPEPSEAQIAAGNAPKGHLRWNGLRISIETAKGGARRGTEPDGTPWEVPNMPVSYGYVRNSRARDGDHVDVFFGPEPQAPQVFVLDQIDPETGRYNEAKSLIGFPSQEDALRAYHGSFSDGRAGERIGAVSAMSVPDFKKWLKSGRTGMPFNAKAVAAVREARQQIAKNLKSPEEGLPKSPILNTLIKEGGVDPSSPLAGELRHMGITKMPGLFRRGGTGALDNWVLSEHTEFGPEANDGNGYIRQDALLDAIREEHFDRPLRPAEVRQEMADHAAANPLGQADEVALDAVLREYGQAGDDHIRTLARQLMADGEDADSAVERAIISAVKEDTTDEEFSTAIPFLDEAAVDRQRGAGGGALVRPTGEEGGAGAEAGALAQREAYGGTGEGQGKAFDLSDIARPAIQETPHAEGIHGHPGLAGSEGDALRQGPEHRSGGVQQAPSGPAAEQQAGHGARAAEPASAEEKAPQEVRQPPAANLRAASRPPGKIEDVGEKIGGARKDRWRERGLTLDDLEAMTPTEEFEHVKKDNIWKAPDYGGLIAEGLDNSVAAGIKIIRDGLAAKPKKDSAEERRRYLEMTSIVRDETMKIKTMEEFATLQHRVQERIGWDFGGGYSQLANREQRAKLFSIFNGRTAKLRIGYGERGRIVDMLQKGWPTPQKKERGRGEDGKPKLPERPHLDKIERRGKDVRGARDIKAEDFLTDFGFRAVEFGNWVASDERQKIVNIAYEGLHDLAEVMGVPPKALSLNGSLALAFGARGSGSARATYEAGRMVINMTKLNGSGSLAHEWGHAFDHYFGTLNRDTGGRGKPIGATGWDTKDDYSGKPRTRFVGGKTVEEVRLENLRPEMRDAFNKVMRALFQKNKTRAEAVRRLELSIESAETRIERNRKTIEGGSAAQKKDAQAYIDATQKAVDGWREELGKIRKNPNDDDPSFGSTPTSYSKEAQYLVGKSADGYWTRPNEMFARAFEAYVQDKIGDRGDISQYLVHGTEGGVFTREKGYKGDPYPVGEERRAINAAFDDLVKTLKVEPGTEALFSRGKRAQEAEYYKRMQEKDRSTDIGPEGKEQTVIPGAEREANKSFLQRKAEAPLKPKAEQKPADQGLFGDGHKQKELFSTGTARTTARDNALAIIQQVAGDDVVVNFAEKIVVPKGHVGMAKWGALASDEAAGSANKIDRLINISLNPEFETNNTAYHEAYHLIEDLKTKQERALFRRELPRLRALAAVDMGMSRAEAEKVAPSEIEAQAFAAYASGREKGIHIGIRAFFAKLLKIIRRIRNMMQGLGYKTADDFFDTALRGEIQARGLEGGQEAGTEFHPAWHGSPHRFGKFSLEHVGKGEGAQAYGYGLYFAGKREVAEYYRQRLAGAGKNARLQVDGSDDWNVFLNDETTTQRERNAIVELHGLLTVYQGVKSAEQGDAIVQRTIRDLKQRIQNAVEAHKKGETLYKDFRTLEGEKSVMTDWRDALKMLEDGRVKLIPAEKPGALYRVELAPKEDEYLDWDKPLSEQSEKVKAALNKLVADVGIPSKTGQRVYYELAAEISHEERRKSWRKWGFTEKQREGRRRAAYQTAWKNGQEFASHALHEAGIPGIRYLDQTSRTEGDGTHNYVIFDEDSIKIEEQFSPGKRAEPIFFSAVVRSVENAKLSKATPDQWMGYLRNQPGVKQDELDWLGVQDWLAGQKSVSKEALADFVRANQVEVREVEKSAPGRGASDMVIRMLAEDLAGQNGDTWDSLGPNGRQRYWDQAARRLDNGGTKFASYQLPGGENYRELLLTLPHTPRDDVAPSASVVARHEAEWNHLVEEIRPLRDRRDQGWRDPEVFTPADQDLWMSLEGDLDRLHQRMVDETLAEARGRLGGEAFRSSHWDEPNVLAHVRFNEREVNGKRVLFIEEIQSDWHQRGRKQGYAKAGGNWKALKDSGGDWEVFDEGGTFITNVAAETEQEAIQTVARLRRGRDASNAVPDAPFKTTWPELSLKRMVRYAAENGFDELAWTPGTVQAERYDLSKQIEELRYFAHGDGTYDLSAATKGDRRLHDIASRVPENKLADHVGKELAEKIAKGEGQPDASAGKWRSFSGLDLKVGGEGMLGFYDRMLPAIANKLGKKFGAKVGTSEIDAASHEGPASWTSVGTSTQRPGSTAQKIWTLPITDSMRESVMSGQPLFSRGKRVDPNAVFGMPNDPRRVSAFTRYATLGRLKGMSDTEYRMKTQDREIYWKRNREQLQAVDPSTSLPEEYDIYQAMTVYRSKAGKQLEDFYKTRARPLVEFLHSARLSRATLDKYLKARAEASRLPRQIKMNPMIAGELQQRLVDAEMTVAAMDASPRADTIRRAVRLFDRIRTETVDVLYNGGLIDAATRGNWLADKGYAPLRGFEEDPEMAAEIARTGRGYDIFGKEAKPALGRLSEADSPLAYMFQQAAQALVRAEKNKVDQRIYGTIHRYPNKEIWEPDPVGFTRVYDQASKTIVVKALNPQATKRADEKHVFGVKFAGEQKFFAVHHEGLARGVRGMGMEDVNGFIRFLDTLNRFRRLNITGLNPEFWETNFMRDAQEAFVNLTALDNKHGPSPKWLRTKIFADVPFAVLGHHGPMAEWAERFEQRGGRIFNYGVDSMQGYRQKIDNALKDGAWANSKRGMMLLIEAVEGFNSHFENAIRLSAFKHLIQDMGWSDERAAAFVKELTVNFDRKGEWATSLNAYKLFYNARIQGTARMAQGLKSKYIRRLCYGMAAVGFLTSMMNYWGSGDDPDDGMNRWDKMPAWQKAGRLTFYFLGTTPISIPTSYGYGFFFSLGSDLADFFRHLSNMGAGSDAVSTAANIYGNFISAVSPLDFGSGAEGTLLGSLARMVAPSAADPLTDAILNENRFGAPQRPPDYGKPTPNSERYFSTENPLLVEVAKRLNSLTGGDKYESGYIDLSPAWLQSLITYSGGGAGTFVEKVAAFANHIVKGEEIPARDVPFNKFFYPTDDRVNQSIYFDLRARADLAEQLLKDGDAALAARAAKRFPVEASIDSNGHHPVLDAFNVAEAIRRGRSKVLRSIDRVEIPEAEKQKMRDDANARVTKAMADARAAWEAARKRINGVAPAP